MKQPPEFNRVTVRSDVVFQRDEDRSTKCWGEPHSFLVASCEAAWERVMLVGSEWQELELGWVKEPSLLILSNPPARWTRNPTEEQQAEADARVIEVCFGQSPSIGCLLVRPGREANIEPAARAWVRCAQGQTKLSIVAIPK